MKHKVLALTLSTVLALSSTTAFAAEETYCTKKYDINNLLRNFNQNYSQTSNTKYKLTINGKSVDLNSINWKELLNKNLSKSKVTEPVEQEQEVTEQVEKKQEVTEPVEKEQETPEKENTQNESKDSTISSSLEYEQKVVELVNVERQKAGLSALTLDTSISNVARTKSKDMANNNYFAHQSPTYGSAGDMLRQFGISWSAWGENIAYGQKTPEIVVDAWMNSPGHRANILSSNFNKIGVGYVTNSNGRPYWTQIFTN
ncbi:CAP domain-containing protein [Sedimentibacter sp. MB31-C6]|uniref:CAP domain-containing protein n=1 Tax=Sedimentibacter sp. MB31-C6 TaxID=3109366 RepID=UPI002DDD220B|nr:CAP domain-containing protein [Sedimentibacter sp. MB36-C1]WSI05181.1 CAP domain-containing protein [Sedimentibacter sp. MB36-C1]